MNNLKIKNQIVNIINIVLEDNRLSEDSMDIELELYGLDSLKFVAMIVALEEEFQIEIPDKYLLYSEMNTVNKILLVVLSIIENRDYQGNGVLE